MEILLKKYYLTILIFAVSCRSYLFDMVPTPNNLVIKYQTNGASEIDNTRIGILGAPFWRGQTQKGVEEGPRVIRESGLISQMKSYGLDVEDFGDLEVKELELPEEDRPSNAHYNKTVSNACQQLSDAIANVLRSGRICVTLGGDHSLGIGSTHGHHQVYPDMSVLWVDAHADINTPESSNSGSIHGMPLSFVVKQPQQHDHSLSCFEWIKPFLEEGRLAYIGLRDVEPYEMEILEKLNIPAYTTEDIDKWGMHEVITRVLQYLNPNGDRTLHVSFDIDSLDDVVAPSTGTPVPVGLTTREAMVIGEQVFRSGYLRSLDIVEVNPSLGTKNDVERTVRAASTVLHAFMGKSRMGNKRKTAEDKCI